MQCLDGPELIRDFGDGIHKGREILDKANIENLYPAADMDEGAKKVIALVNAGKK